MLGEGHRKSLTKRQRKFIAGKVQGKTNREAALDAGYSDSTAKHAERILRRPGVKQALLDLLERAVPDEKLVRRLAEGIDATETKFFSFQGEVTAEREVVNYAERRAYLELVAKLRGLLQRDPLIDAERIEHLQVTFVQPDSLSSP